MELEVSKCVACWFSYRSVPFEKLAVLPTACGLSSVLRPVQPADISIWCVAAVLRCLPWSVQALRRTGRILGGQLAKDAGNNWPLTGHCNKCPASLGLSATSSLTKPTNQALYGTYKIAMQMLAVPAFKTGAQTV